MTDNFESRWIRIKKAINLEIPDRVPIVPIVAYFAGRYGGITAHEFMFDTEVAKRAQEKIFDDMEGWDAQIWPEGFVSAEIFPFLFPNSMTWRYKMSGATSSSKSARVDSSL